jgi:hypothetical protein
MDSIWIKGNALRPVLLTRLLYRPVFAAFVMRTRFSKEPAVFVTLQVFGGKKIASKRLSVPKNTILFSPEVRSALAQERFAGAQPALKISKTQSASSPVLRIKFVFIMSAMTKKTKKYVDL